MGHVYQYGELDGPHQVLRNDVNEFASTAVVTGVAELELQTIRNPVSGNEIHPEMLYLRTDRQRPGSSKIPSTRRRVIRSLR